jgi:peroxiredoxin
LQVHEKGEKKMALTPSKMVPLGTSAIDFSLTDVASGKSVSLKNFDKKKALLIMFICRHCPYVQHMKRELARIGKDYENENVGIVAISANDALKYPDDAPNRLKEFCEENGYNFPLCFDDTQEVAKAYYATCTPDFFLYNKDRKLVYRGQLDDSRPDNGKPVSGKDLRAAMDAVLKDQPVPFNQKPSMGCNIKWKTGKEPVYARVL